MKINFAAPITTLDGKPMMVSDKSDAVATLGFICLEVLQDGAPDEKIDGAEKMRRFKLAMSIHGAGELSVGVEDVGLLKDLIGKAYSTRIVGPAWTLLDGEPD